MSGLRDLFENLEVSESHQPNARQRGEKEYGTTPVSRWAKAVTHRLETAVYGGDFAQLARLTHRLSSCLEEAMAEVLALRARVGELERTRVVIQPCWSPTGMGPRSHAPHHFEVDADPAWRWCPGHTRGA